VAADQERHAAAVHARAADDIAWPRIAQREVQAAVAPDQAVKADLARRADPALQIDVSLAAIRPVIGERLLDP